jgi:hypothetical protein
MTVELQEPLWRNASERRYLVGCRSLRMSGQGEGRVSISNMSPHRGLIDVPTHNPRFPILILLWEIQWDGENVDVGKRVCQPTTPIFKVGPIYTRTASEGSLLAVHKVCHETKPERNSHETKKVKKRTVAIKPDSDLWGDVRE